MDQYAIVINKISKDKLSHRLFGDRCTPLSESIGEGTHTLANSVNAELAVEEGAPHDSR